jgi:hypothetical protein
VDGDDLFDFVHLCINIELLNLRMGVCLRTVNCLDLKVLECCIISMRIGSSVFLINIQGYLLLLGGLGLAKKFLETY